MLHAIKNSVSEAKKRGNENSARRFYDRNLLNPPGSWTKRVFLELEALTDFLTLDVHPNDPPDVPGVSLPKAFSLCCSFVPDQYGLH